MPSYQYYSSAGSKISISTPINFCMREGPMSFCKACTMADQYGCKYREDASRGDCCLYYRYDYDGACDCVWAHKNIDKPKDEEEDELEDDTEQAMTIIPT